MRNYIIFHGHFYQPPREDPWTGIVGTQPSAAPFHDWNHRITRECYAANAASRFLRYDGRIEDIINNYRVLSFNFGPTLFWWLKYHAPHIYEAILEADRLSVEKNNGHGNAIAQAYNHTILPLDSPEDARLQIQWGLADFEYHFERPSEGIWLPETAINDTVADILLEEKVKFVILSPWQAEAIYAEGSEEWEELENQPAPFWRAYKIERPAGELAVFFYNQELAQGISFEHYLRSADALYTRLLTYHNNADPGHLIHVATDGEVYGHHEPFGDMCLAALQQHIEQDQRFEFTNYANYLEQFPPKHKARLWKGEEKLGSSWSCPHGVSRWYKDCGCSTGGKRYWNQKWRTPLRKGFQKLSERIQRIYAEQTAELCTTTPEALLKQYIAVLTTNAEPKKFAQTHLKQNRSSEDDIAALLSLLEGQKYRMYMFTSCGWFFSDIAGIEPVQNIRYALKALDLYNSFTKEDLYAELASTLESAHSNNEDEGTGRDILEREAHRWQKDGVEAASYFFIRRIIDTNEETQPHYGFFKLLQMIELSKEPSTAKLKLIDTTLQKKISYELKAEHDLSGSLNISVKNLHADEPHEFIEDLSQLPLELRQNLTNYLLRSTEAALAEYSAETFEDIRFALQAASHLGTRIPPIIRHSAEVAATTLLYRQLKRGAGLLTEEEIVKVEDTLLFAARYNINIEVPHIIEQLMHLLRDFFEQISVGGCRAECSYMVRLIKALRAASIEPDLTIPQKIVFHHLSRCRKQLADKPQRYHTYHKIDPQKLAKLNTEERDQLKMVIDLCLVMGIYADDIIHALSVLEEP
ncbi:MAG: DUF3536 domain-containing protein [Spirochaetia bacterium]